MKRTIWALILFILIPAASVLAQMGTDMFQRPSILKVFHPVVGKGAQYLTTSKTGGSSRREEYALIAKETVDGKEGYWMQMVNIDDKGDTKGGKALITVDDFQFHRMIMDVPGQGLMEVPANMMVMSAKNRQDLQDNMRQWHSVGSDTVTVPAGTFSCEHWRNDKDHEELWTSDTVVPFGMVKEVGPTTVMVLVKTLDEVPDRFSGPAKKFDMQQMMQQMQQQMQQRQ